MNLIGGLAGGISRRIMGVIAVVIGTVFIFICGALMAFVLAPQQALESSRIEGLPQLNAQTYAQTAAGADVAITGTLQGNEKLTTDGLVAYYRDRWDVTQSSATSSSDSKPTYQGAWKRIETKAPPLAIAISGGTVHTLAADQPTFGGALKESIKQGSGSLSAEYNGESLPDGTIRTAGFTDGSLITVVGQKASTGDILPQRLFAGDRVALVADIRNTAQGLFVFGIAMMVCSPLFLVVGIAGVILGHRRGLFG